MENISLTEGQSIHGYTVNRICSLPSIDSTFIELTHLKTQARHIHIANTDKENTFSVIFRTVPKDSSGVAHILEHTVLCGSKKFNVRDPFFSMIKRSLSTFMNAFTASDWTMYPFSSQNEKDYYNLMDVYLDAAFFPRIDELSFKQEGHRLDIREDQDHEAAQGIQLEYKGVVYNEMKGAMSSPGQVMGRALLKSLYPDTTYSNNSGGEPSRIPDLTWEGLKAFHGQYYHPSNACFYTYGNLPLEKSLEYISTKVLDQFDQLEMDTRVPPQPRWDSPRTDQMAYAFADAETIESKYQGCLAWLTCDVNDNINVLALSILEQVLLGNSASPLRKALIDSKLGSALSDSTGFEPDNKAALFVCGLKDIKKESVAAVETIIFDTLKTLVDKGIDKSLIESAIHQIEFHRKEITNTPYPFGIKLLLSFSGVLIHDGDPVSCVNIDQDLEYIKGEIQKGPYLENLIQTYFLDNPHRVSFTLEPDLDLEEKTNAETRRELAEKLKTLTERDLEEIKADAKALEALQEAEEDLSVLPTLALSDVPPEIEIIKPDHRGTASPATCYDKATSGILYFTCPVGAGDIPAHYFPLLPFFSKAFTNGGTRNFAYTEMAEKMDLYTGGIAMSPFSGSYFDQGGNSHSFMALHGKALDRNVDKLFEMIQEFVLNYEFKDMERLNSLLLQYQAGMEASIVSTGHRYAISLASRHLSQASHINELWHGIHQYQYIKGIAEQAQGNPEILTQLASDFATLAQTLFKKDNFRPAVIGSTESMARADQCIADIMAPLSTNGDGAFVLPELERETQRPYNGWYTNTAVSFVGQAFKTVRITHPDSPGLAVIAKILRSKFLHREIREKGGAYGGFALYNTEEGIFSFGSYRDPHIKRTLDVYGQACNYIMDGDYTETDVKEAILQVCSEIDKPETPGPAAMKAFYRDITKLSDEIRKNFKDALLNLDRSRVLEIARTYFNVAEEDKGVSVISSKPQLEAANAELKAQGQAPLELFKI
ncbi:MAG: insulinase family protein [Desulfobacterales bacterium]|nr:insulinase family protein [Desulfobacterales bacterium]